MVRGGLERGGGNRLVVGGFGEQVKGAFISREQGIYKCNFLGEQANKENTEEHETPGKQIFDFWEQGNKQIHFTGPCTPNTTPPPLPCEGLDGQWIIRPRYRHKHYSSV